MLVRHMILMMVMVFTALPGVANQARTQVQVFVDGHMKAPHYPNTDVTVYDMKASKRLLKTVPIFSPDQEKAKQEFAQWLKTPKGQTFLADMKQAHRGTEAMSRLKVLKIPAIVIDQSYVVYGSTDIRQALQIYRAKMRAK